MIKSLWGQFWTNVYTLPMKITEMSTFRGETIGSNGLYTRGGKGVL